MKDINVMTEPLLIGDVEIISFNTISQLVSMVVHLNGNPMSLDPDKTQRYVAHRIACAANYLVEEGFLPDPDKEIWKILFRTSFHSPVKFK